MTHNELNIFELEEESAQFILDTEGIFAERAMRSIEDIAGSGLPTAVKLRSIAAVLKSYGQSYRASGI